MDQISLRTRSMPATVEAVNARHWPGARLARRLAKRRLRPAELEFLSRYDEQLSGDVLELGSSGDRLTAALTAHARTLKGIGRSTPTVDLCRELHPTATFLERDLRDLHSFEDDRFDAIVAGHGAIDLLGDHERRLLLDHIRRILSNDGVLIFSSHNLGCESLVPPPGHHLTLHPIRLLSRLRRMPRALRNRAHLRRLQEREHGYAILNDPTLNYSLLHYYISRDSQELQLSQHGFEMLDCLGPDGLEVPPGEAAYGRRELYYAAIPARVLVF